MREYFRLKVAGLERDLPICAVSDKLDIAGFVIFGDAELTEACARDLLKIIPEYDYLITAEAKGIPLVHEMARQHGDKKHFVARKGLKVYMVDTISVTVMFAPSSAQTVRKAKSVTPAMGPSAMGLFTSKLPMRKAHAP